MSHAPALMLSQFLPYRLSVLAAVVSEGLARTYSERFGINIPEWRVLATVGEFRSISAKAIGLHAHMSKVKVSRAVASLEHRGLIRRVANNDDLRESFLALTSKGQAIYEEIVPLALAYVDHLTEALSSAELDRFDRTVEKLLGRAGEWNGTMS